LYFLYVGLHRRVFDHVRGEIVFEVPDVGAQRAERSADVDYLCV
jgi:hypothetical protein